MNAAKNIQKKNQFFKSLSTHCLCAGMRVNKWKNSLERRNKTCYVLKCFMKCCCNMLFLYSIFASLVLCSMEIHQLFFCCRHSSSIRKLLCMLNIYTQLLLLVLLHHITVSVAVEIICTGRQWTWKIVSSFFLFLLFMSHALLSLSL
jgi:hypothetical protein